MSRTFLFVGALAAGLAVVFGAFGAHALSSRLTAARLNTFEIGVRYQMYHALALLVVGWWAAQKPLPQVEWAGYFFIAGILIFSGSLYLLVLTETRWLGAVTPLGGVAFIAGWALLAWAALQRS